MPLEREDITHINSEWLFRGRIDIGIIAWDQAGAAVVAMEAGLTPQETISQGFAQTRRLCDLSGREFVRSYPPTLN